MARKALPKLDELQIPHEADLTLCGDSAGGCMAAYTSQALQHDTSIPLTHQVLVYPCLDMTHSFPSVRENCNVKTGFTPAKLVWYFNQFFRTGDDRRAASPLFCELSADMSATLVLTTQFCPFRDEGREYVRRLTAKGVRAETYNYDNMVHSYLNFEKICYDEICDTYRRMADFLQL